MPTFQSPEIETDPDVLVDQILDSLMTRLEGWEPVEGSVDTALAEEFATEQAVVAQAALDAVTTAIAGIGETLHGLPVQTGTAATLAADVVVSAPGDLIPAGLIAIGINGNGDEVLFTLPADVVAAGTTQAVTFTAADVGVVYNGVAPGLLVVATSTATVVSATTTTASSGGVDVEDLEAYTARLIDHLSRLRVGGVRGDDLAAVARTVPGVDRATGIDLYDPAQPGLQVERTATVVAVDVDNQPVSAPVKAAVLAAVQAVREVNFVVHVADPTYTDVAIAYTAVAETGADPAAVKAAIDGALTVFLSDWGALPGQPRTWVNQTVVRYLDVVRVAGSAPGVAFLSSITVNGGTADVTLPGTGPLPSPVTAGGSTITGSVQ